MSDYNKTEGDQDKKKEKPTYWEKVLYGKGTASEPWPTAAELWNDPKVQKSIQKHNAEVRKRQKN